MRKPFENRMYKGWLIHKERGSGMYAATKPYSRYLRADTLEGMKGIITSYEKDRAGKA